MPDTTNNFLKPTKDLKNLQLLEEISKNANTSQRKLSGQLGVALGVTNACLKKMIQKGYIKIKGINHKRISYFLTPKGFSEKARLTYYFLEYTIHYYINLKKNISSKLNAISGEGAKRVIYYGAGEVMEVAFVTLHETPLELVGIIDDDSEKQGKKRFGFVIQGIEAIKELKPDTVIITSIRYKDKIMKKMSENEELSKIPVYTL